MEQSTYSSVDGGDKADILNKISLAAEENGAMKGQSLSEISSYGKA